MRLIPARAGKTRAGGPRHRREWAHPRSRGENRSAGVHSMSASGSSPLARGKLMQVISALLPVRLIPARAGKTFTALEKIAFTPAHPRSRGENLSNLGSVLSTSGSSPLARGKRRRKIRDCKSCRLIPARAGKTLARSAQESPRAAHPRSRGENLAPVTSVVGRAGSSPLARGKPRRRRAGRPQRGLIPARAGKTKSSSQERGSERAHPRSRGENGWRRCAPMWVPGSSPLARGKRES